MNEHAELPTRTPSAALEHELATEWRGFAPPPNSGWFGERLHEVEANQSKRGSFVTFFGQLDLGRLEAGEH